MNPKNYASGVEKGRQEGLIRGVSSSDIAQFGHTQSGLNDKNSRKLDPAIARVLRAWPERSPKFLELGPGSGVAASQVSLLNPKAIIHTAAGLTPINPYWRFNRRVVFGDKKSVAHEIGVLGSDPDQLMQEQRKGGLVIFDEVEEPFIGDQHLGHLDGFTPKEADYDIVYESCGPNFHRLSEDLCRRTFELLSEGGVLSMNSRPVADIDPVKVPFRVSMGSHTLFIARGNFLAEALTRHLGRQERVVDRALLSAMLDGFIEKKKRGGVRTANRSAA